MTNPIYKTSSKTPLTCGHRERKAAQGRTGFIFFLTSHKYEREKTSVDGKLGRLSPCCRQFSQSTVFLHSSLRTKMSLGSLYQGSLPRTHLGLSQQCYIQLRMCISSSAVRHVHAGTIQQSQQKF